MHSLHFHVPVSNTLCNRKDRRMKIVFLEAGSLGNDMDFTSFEKFGDTLVYENTTSKECKTRTKDADIIICNKLKMCEDTLKNARNLKLICITATGTNNIDRDYLVQRGIAVTNVTGYSTDSVAQHTFALYFYLAEKMRYYDEFVKDGSYAASASFTNLDKKFQELSGKVWGIIGLGNIGRKTAQIAEAFGCRIVYYSTSGNNNQIGYKRLALDEFLSQADVISIHAPLNEKTEKLLGQKEFQIMKKSALLINVARGPIIDEQALYDALVNDRIAGAGLDVLETEPMSASNPLMQIQDSCKLVITPHIAWAAVECRERLLRLVAENIESYQKGGRLSRVI